MKIFRFPLLLLFVLAACEAPQDETSYAQERRDQWRVKAESGDAEAQYQMGNAWCCGGDGGFFSTKEAIVWWQKAADQGHAGAKKKLKEHQNDGMPSVVTAPAD